MKYQPLMKARDYQAKANRLMKGREAFALLMAMRTGKTKTILDEFGTYESLAARTLTLDGLHPHPAGKPTPDTLAAYRLATDLLETTLLPAARNLTDRVRPMLALAVSPWVAPDGDRLVLWIDLDGVCGGEPRDGLAGCRLVDGG